MDPGWRNNILDQLLCTTTGTDCTSGVLTSYTYDGRGNLRTESDGTNITTYTWDAQDRLSSASIPGGPNISYGYDADGRRVSQTVGSMATSYLWDEFSTYGDVVYETNGTQTISYVLGHDRLISQRVNGTASYFLHDGQGSTRALTDVTGTVTDTYDYTAFGQLYAQTGTTSNSYLYTGQQFDAATEQYYLRAREYDPVVGRFLSRDTWAVDMWNPEELNRYGYVANNPIGFFDPTGNMELVWQGISLPQSMTLTYFAGTVVAVSIAYLLSFSLTWISEILWD